MIIIYDKEDEKGGDSSVPFLDRNPYFIEHQRTPAANQSETRLWVDNNNQDPNGIGDDKVYKHYVPYEYIFSAINDYIVGKSNNRLQVIEWLENVAVKLGIPKGPIEDIKQISRIEYNDLADYYVSSICDWQENIFRGASGGDGDGTKNDIPKNPDLAKKMEAAATKLLAALAT